MNSTTNYRYLNFLTFLNDKAYGKLMRKLGGEEEISEFIDSFRENKVILTQTNLRDAGDGFHHI